MIKLSELKNDTMLCVEDRYDGEFSVMSKEDFLESSYFFDYPVEPFPSVKLADKEIKTFDLWDAIERIGEDDTYEGWDEEVYYALKDLPATVEFLQRIKKVFENHPVYWEGKPVEIDILPEAETEQEVDDD